MHTLVKLAPGPDSFVLEKRRPCLCLGLSFVYTVNADGLCTAEGDCSEDFSCDVRTLSFVSSVFRACAVVV